MIKLNDSQLKQMAEFLSNLGIVFIGVVIAGLFSGTKNVSIFYVLTGLVFMIIYLLISMFLLRRIES